MTLQLITAPTAEPITLDEAKLHLRVSHSTEDTLIEALIVAARMDVEGKIQRALLPQTWQRTLDRFPCRTARACADTSSVALDEIRLPRGPVASVESVKYLDVDGTLQTLVEGTDYQVDLADDKFGRVLPVYGGSWPSTRDDINAVRVRYVAGWPDVDSVPAPIKAWLKLRIGGLYENREQFVPGVEIKTADFVDHLLDTFLVHAV